MGIPQTDVQRSKVGVHILQAFLIFLGGCLALAVLTDDGGTSGAVGFYFGLCFLTVPALIYQIMVPMWTRAWRFANVYVYPALDLLFALLWFAASISVATWQSKGIKQGAKGDTAKNGADGGCSNFAHGSESRCKTSKAGVGFGVVIFLLFALTTGISIWGLLKYRKTGIMPYGGPGRHGKVEQVGVEDPSKDPWSTNTDELGSDRPSNDGEDRSDSWRAYGQIPQEDEQQLLHRPSQDNAYLDVHRPSMTESLTEHGAHPGRPLSFASSTNLSIAPPAYHKEAPQSGVISPTGYVAPSALSPSDYEQTPGGRVYFPRGNYGADFSCG